MNYAACVLGMLSSSFVVLLLTVSVNYGIKHTVSLAHTGPVCF